MIIRNARETDFVECVSIAHRAWPEFNEREAIYHILCRHFPDTCFMSEEGGKIHGFLLGFISQADSREAYIHLICVEPSAQRQGVARRLYDEFFKTARRLGAQCVRLTVAPNNVSSLKFHGSVGFQPDIRGESIQIGNILAAKDYNGPGNHMVPFIREI